MPTRCGSGGGCWTRRRRGSWWSRSRCGAGQRLIFRAARQGTNAHNDVYLAGKRRVVEHFGHSSSTSGVATRSPGRRSRTATSFRFPEFAPHGGGVPLIVGARDRWAWRSCRGCRWRSTTPWSSRRWRRSSPRTRAEPRSPSPEPWLASGPSPRTPADLMVTVAAIPAADLGSLGPRVVAPDPARARSRPPERPARTWQAVPSSPAIARCRAGSRSWTPSGPTSDRRAGHAAGPSHGPSALGTPRK